MIKNNEFKDREYFDGYFTMPCEHGFGKVMVLTGPWKSKFYNKMLKKKISVLRLSESAGWKETDITFVSELMQLRSIEIYSWRINDISPIKNLFNLERIALQCEFKKPVDFSVFKKLSNCFMMWRPKCDSIFSCNSLIKLNMTRYPYEDLLAVRKLENLKTLKLTSRKLESLRGIENLTQLDYLDLFECTKLIDLEGLGSLSCLSKIDIETCKKISNINMIGALKQLKWLSLDNCGEIESLLPLKQCKNLELLCFTGSTNILDGDLSFINELKNLKKVFFSNMRHYSHKFKEIQEILNQVQTTDAP